MAPSHTDPPFVIGSSGGRGGNQRDEGDKGRGMNSVDDYYDSNGRSRLPIVDGPSYAPSNSAIDRSNGGGDMMGESMEGSNAYFPPSPNGNEKPANDTNGPVVIVRGEEIGIVVVVLLLWVGAIILFFNRWGKIRMLEPYQPKFCESHRPSCPMTEVTTAQQYPDEDEEEDSKDEEKEDEHPQ